MSTHLEIHPMTLPKHKKLSESEAKSIESAVEEAGIVAIHPDKMEEFAEYLVQKTRAQEPKPWRTGSSLQA
tara:strand:- start:13 stop:225 length:213 start_codon:yes stop_codon:yes gene_type:complete